MKMKENKEYYAVLRGRVEKPTIFSSWGHAHPRVTGCASVHKGFCTVAEARGQMKKWNVPSHLEIIKSEAELTTPSADGKYYYAVACGSRPGIYPFYRNEAEPEVKEVSGACHKRFGLKQQAEEFIDDWKQSFIEVFAVELKRALDQGFRPRDMKLSLKDILQEPGTADEMADDKISHKMESLGIKDEK